MVQEDEILGRAYDSRLMSRLLTYLRPYKKQVALAFVLILGTTFTGLAGPFLLSQAVNNAIAPGKFDLLVTIALIYLGMVALGFVFRYAQNYVMQLIGQHVMYDMRQKIFTHLQNQSLSYFDRTIGLRPVCVKLAIDRQIEGITVPTQCPQWFDSSSAA